MICTINWNYNCLPVNNMLCDIVYLCWQYGTENGKNSQMEQNNQFKLSRTECSCYFNKTTPWKVFQHAQWRPYVRILLVMNKMMNKANKWMRVMVRHCVYGMCLREGVSTCIGWRMPPGFIGHHEHMELHKLQTW